MVSRDNLTAIISISAIKVFGESISGIRALLDVLLKSFDIISEIYCGFMVVSKL